ncbi:hypothetical protein [Streptomyces sp. AM 2-1-1]|uniref:hypothetical protein n=1 Tax=Streptomyces sp. AM 2-1-1 TaxID=3028709 RepID=UPI0023BA3ABE|nr:hypothetical protein [Streptomyces sp. AM 2-1-1]WEH41739.1 hypothetical protein PZB77_20805 [Streptomyces sp. AM 2-1-1]
MTGVHRAGGTFRLLPWTGAGGKPAYVRGDGTGYVSRLADNIESVQLGMAGDLLGHATALLADQRVTGAELRFLANRLSESLRDIKRVAESRGARLDSYRDAGAGRGEETGDAYDVADAVEFNDAVGTGFPPSASPSDT